MADKREILDYNTITVKKRNEIIKEYRVLTKTLNETDDLVKISKANNNFIAAVNEFNFYITTSPTDPKLKELKDLNAEYAQICFSISETVDLILQTGTKGKDITPLLDDYNEKKAKLNLLNDEIYEKGINMLSFV
ncbi:hypothetical protein GF362_02840 [Candidatus Dojkabacteria bacterium]|nr:hypothetical protein [Candidatus Dojkabacteria bacterium]